MDPALWLLLWLRLRGWFRRLRRNAQSVRGVLLLLVGLFFFGCVFLNPLLTVLAAGHTERAVHLENMRQFGALGLVGYCILNVLFSTSERAVSFTPAEVNLLFSAPFSRRQLLGYKVVAACLTCLVTALFMMVFLVANGAWPVAAYLGMVLTLLFLTLYGMAVSLLLTTLGARAYTRRRQVALIGLGIIVLAVLLSLGRDFLHLPPEVLLERLRSSPALRILLTPFSWFIEASIAPRLWPDLVEYSAGCILVNLVLLAAIFALDAQYLEASAAASERIYARLQQMRSGGAFAAWRPTSGTPRFTLPTLPSWGGIGPTAWRQLLTGLRSLRGLFVFLLIFGGALATLPVFMALSGEQTNQPAVGHALGISLIGVSLLSLPALLAFDFRGDLDRFDVLKALPIPSWRLVLGQLATPVLLLSFIQVGSLLLIETIWGGLARFLIVAVVLAVPVNFLSLGIDNLLFLWFPTRQMVATPGDFQLMGRHMLLLLTKTFVLATGLAAAALVALLTYLVVHFARAGAVAAQLAALAAGGLILTLCAAALVPFLALAFQNFDVAHDTPA